MLRLKRSLVLLAAAMISFAVFSGFWQQARAQQLPTPSSDQIDMFRNMTQEQQDAILQRLGGGSSSSSSSSSSSNSQLNDRQQQTEQQRQNRIKSGSDSGDMEAIPTFRADDWVILEIDFHLQPRPISPSLQALYAQRAATLPQGTQLANAAGAMSPGSPDVLNSAQQQPSAVVSSEPLTDEEKKRQQDIIDLIRQRNPYRLTPDGVLNLPGFAGIPLLGLTEDQATLRLKTEPGLSKLDVRATRMPLKQTGSEGLKPFGYDLFDASISTFAPATNVPVPSDYTIGAGDMLEVQLYGTQNRTVRLTVGRDGRINLPELGPISVAGQLFGEAKAAIEARIERQLIGVHGNVSMGDIRSLRVFVLGETRNPGSYVVSALSTMTSALFAAGGVDPNGSLRRIQLKRRGVMVRELDLYDMLIRGDTHDDLKVEQGDAIFIPPIGPTVGISGEVRRPAIYEIRNETSVADILNLAGGLTPQGDRSNAMLTRIDEKQRRVVVPMDISADKAKVTTVHNGDLLQINRLRPTFDAAIVVQGHVFTPGTFEYHPGLHLTDLIRTVDELRPNADLHYLLIRREVYPGRHIAALSADLAAALLDPNSKANILLQPRDQITVFDRSSPRARVMKPLLDELRLEATSAQPSQVVHVDGRVNVSGDYPLESGMTVADLIRAGGGLSDSAYGTAAELTRYQIVDGDVRKTQVITVNLDAVSHGDPASNVVLQPFDNLSVKEVSEWQSQADVELTGEVRFPGRYTVKRGETLKSVILRAGGLTDLAFPQGSVFTRRELKVREQEQLDLLAERIQRDLAILAVQATAAAATVPGGGGGGAASISVGQSLLSQLKGTKAVGRLVIDLPRMLHESAGSPTDVILRDGDHLIVPKFQQQVTVIGEVQYQTSHLFSSELSRDDYIGLSGGTTRNADHRRIYVVRANGSVVANEGNRWFEHSSTDIKPGDTIVVPLDATKMPALPLWTAVTTIIYNVAIAVAAVRSF
jgi:polysaccharide export outer membrane protein